MAILISLMFKSFISYSSLLRPALAIGIFLLAASGIVSAQSGSRPSDPPLTLELDKERDKSPMLSMELEMRARRQLEMAEKNYRNNLTRARNLAILTSDVIDSYNAQKFLTEDDLKKLEKAEKLAKTIREAAGGSENDTKIDKPPATLDAALVRVGELATSLKEKVEKTPKHVISAAVINEANVLLELFRITRTLSNGR
ncbi:MAG TPA: hypothetical protein VGW36_02015 [Pyrinomonadaceae bacterium]|nr:hypothetical protein [Pyrinomonadaceae bacterium]